MPRPTLPKAKEVAGISKALRAEGYHRLQICEAAATFIDQNGERVEYTRASDHRLATYISDVQRQLAGQSLLAALHFSTSKGLI